MDHSSKAVDRGAKLLAAGAVQQAVQVVAAAAERGDPDALHQLALWHVYGQPLPRDFGAARTLFGRAGEAGHAGAAITHAVFVALGAGGLKPDWRGALRLLHAAAEKDPVAAKQAKLLDAMALDNVGAPAHVPKIEPLSLQPRIGVLRGLFTAAECAHVAALAKPLLTPSIVVDSTTGKSMLHPIRTSDGAVLGPIQQDLVLEALNRRIAAATGTRAEQGEPLTVLRYSPGQQYRLHHDCLPGERNQRIITAIVYLNDGYAGGATCFPETGVEFKGKAGDAIVFANVRGNGQVEEKSRHAGRPVERGEKWISTRWIRAGDFDPWGLRG
ncbi:2OG-Fe(II) oxygenase [Sphingomonas cavernae]|uniref:Proline hydroxylase n=1 Tax=Sphingomonas cavernae TaxID=2320861 RepID=A0A418W6A7_9SPHN|nr:2OG-Fe(II) oxygenase [Sphingomonas cavernae]RJF85552.1 proline hydroxylase [Sphingomonas cavernae]